MSMAGLTDARRRAISRIVSAVDAADLGGPLRRIFHHLVLELFEADAAGFDIVLVVEVLGDEHVHEAVEEGDVAAHLDRQMHGRQNRPDPCVRGSTTMSSAPFMTAFLTKVAATGWASVMLEPMTRNILAFANSAKELVIAPEPKVVARPATVGACQVRAQ